MNTYKARSQKPEARSQKGQILIVVILVLLVVSLIILAAASRSITDVKISQTSEESARAFSAAEAGVEEAVERIDAVAVPILTPAPIALPNNPNAGAYTVAQVGGVVGQAFLFPEPLVSDVATFQVYLADRDNLTTGNYKGTVCLMWGNPGAPPPIPALEASVIYQASTPPTTRVARFAIDPDDARRLTNGFIPPNSDPLDPDEDPGDGPCPNLVSQTENNLGIDRTFQYTHRLRLKKSNLPGIADCGGGARCVQLLRVRLLYAQANLHYAGVRPMGGRPLPVQGHTISSTGVSGQSTRKVQVFRSFPSLPAIFDFALYNHTGGISK